MQKYMIIFDEELTNKLELFERITDVVKLGYSGIENWDAFRELMINNLEYRDIEIEIDHRCKLALPTQDEEMYLDFRSELAAQFGDRITFRLNS
ncbi:MAG: hypothetical protein AAF067_13455 [Pseudomonadota bacterium]